MPSKNDVQLMREEVEFTQNQLEINRATVKSLQQQKVAQMEELERARTLEERMDEEMQELAKRTCEMREEMEQYEDLSSLKEDSAAMREELADKQINVITLSRESSAPLIGSCPIDPVGSGSWNVMIIHTLDKIRVGSKR